jgi:homoserine dehydrogenase
MGYRIKMLAIIKRQNDEVFVRVHPTLVPLKSMLASVGGVFNAVWVTGDIVGDTLYYGRGAGRLPTASAVVSDIADAAESLALNCGWMEPPFVRDTEGRSLGDFAKIKSRFYLRMMLLNKPGVLARVAQVLGAHEIGIASMMQKEQGAGAYVPVIMVTDIAQEGLFADAMKEIDQLDVVGAPTVRLRMEEL